MQHSQGFTLAMTIIDADIREVDCIVIICRLARKRTALRPLELASLDILIGLET